MTLHLVNQVSKNTYTESSVQEPIFSDRSIICFHARTMSHDSLAELAYFDYVY